MDNKGKDCRPKGMETISAALSKAKKYHAWLFSMAEPFLGRRVLEVGPGLGIYTEFLKDRELLISIDIAADCVSGLRERYDRFENIEIREMDLNDPGVAGMLAGEKPDSAICLNVLEHIDNDALFLASLRKVLAPAGGRLVVIVPAHPFLFGSLDTAAGHYRRYTREDLRRKLEGAGFDVIKINYFNSVGAVGWFIASRLLRQRRLSSWATGAEIIAFEKAILPFSRFFDRLLRGRFGQSLLAVAVTSEKDAYFYK